MILSKYIWDLYKESKQGKETIDFFEYHNVFWNDVKVINKYNPIYGKWIEKKGL
nr:hypothetical protein [uncultured Capnocytophaga sp.]